MRTPLLCLFPCPYLQGLSSFRVQTSFHQKTYTMAKTFLIVLLSVYLLLLTFIASAQPASPKLPRWVTDKGFWVVESNLHTPKQSTVFFYTNDGVLVYKEAVVGRRINVQRKHTRIHLTSVLEQSVRAWEKNQALQENQQWLARRLN